MAATRFEQIPARLGARLRLRIPPEPRHGRYVRDQIVAFAAGIGIVTEELDDFLTALGEALANAVEHSGARDPVEITVWMVGENKLVATVVDNGIGFEPTGSAVNEPRLPDSFAERGRGIPIMRSCSDIFSVQSAPGKGTAVTLGRFVQRDGQPRRRIAAG